MKEEKNDIVAADAGDAASASGESAGKELDSPGIPANPHSRMIEKFSSTSMIAGPVVNPVFQKVTSEHISESLKMRGAREKSDDKYRSSNRFFVLAYVMLGVTVLAGATYWFSKDNPDLYVAILSHTAAFAAGISGGWGYATAKRK